MPAKALFIGLDGLDDVKVEPLIAAGDMPNIAALRGESQTALIRNYPGMGAGAFWTSAACGAAPDYHGRFFYMRFNPETYEHKVMGEDDPLDAPSFWKTLDQEGRRVGVVDWFRGPFEELENGFVLDNWHGHDASWPTRSSPVNMTEKVLAAYGTDPYAHATREPVLDSLEAHQQFVEETLARIETKTRLACAHLSESDWDLYAPTFSELHHVDHVLYHVTDEDHPRHDPDLLNALGDPLRTCYMAIDKAVGALAEAAGPDAAVMMMAGPGMTRLISANESFPEILRRLDAGVSGGGKPVEKAKNAYHGVLPKKWRNKLAPLAARVRRKVSKNLFAHRRFIHIPHNANSACVRINMKGRERYGVVEPGAQYDQTVESLCQDLMALRDANTGLPVVENIVRRKDNYHGPKADTLPDLFVEWNRSAELKSLTCVASPKIGEINIPMNHRTGDHTATGFFCAKGVDGDIFREAGWRLPHEIAAVVLKASRGKAKEPQMFAPVK